MDDQLNNGNGGRGVQTGDIPPGGAPPGGVPPAITPEAMQIQMQTMQQLMNQQMELLRLQMQNNAVVAQQITPPVTAPQPQQAEAVSSIKRANAPCGRYDMNSHELRTYTKDCNDFKKLTACTDEQAVLQMRLNMDEPLKQAIDANYSSTWDGFTVKEALEAVGTILKRTTNPVVFRKQFDGMVQSKTESVKEFITRLKICAEDCNFVCPFEPTHNLTEYHLINRIRSGVANKKLQQELLQNSTQLNKLDLITAYCENYETSQQDIQQLHTEVPSIASNELQDASEEEIVAALSMYRKDKRGKPPNKNTNPEVSKKCWNCGLDFPHTNGPCTAKNHKCNTCKRKGHFELFCRKGEGRTLTTSAIIISGINSICGSDVQVSNLPLVPFNVGHGNTIPETVDAVADTGAGANVAGPLHMRRLGITSHDLRPPPHTLQHVGGQKLPVLGVHTLYITHNSELIETEVYFVEGVTHMYLSLDSCKKLHLVDPDFPLNNTEHRSNSAPSNRKPINIGAIVDQHVRQDITERLKTIPDRPADLPYPATEENIPALEEWLRDAFKGACLNVKDELLKMSGGPLKFVVDEKDDSDCYRATTPIPVAYHWREKVNQKLEENIQKGIMRRAPSNKPTKWCMRMVVVGKKNGEPRLTVDYQPINKHCKRIPHVVPRPFDVISNISGKNI